MIVGQCTRCDCAVEGIGREKSGLLFCDSCRREIVAAYLDAERGCRQESRHPTEGA